MLQELLRNIRGVQLRSEGTTYSDVEVTPTNKDTYMGASNGEVCGIIISRGRTLFLPCSMDKSSHRVLNKETSSLLFAGGPATSIAFNPFEKNTAAVLVETSNPSGPPNVGLCLTSYDSNCINDVGELNKSAVPRLIFDQIHEKRPCEVKWSPIVKDLLYTAGNQEIKIIKYKGLEEDIEQIAEYRYMSEDDSHSAGYTYIADFSLSPDGKYLAAFFSNTSGLTLCVFKSQIGDEDNYEINQIASYPIEKGQLGKCCMSASGNILTCYLMQGKRKFTSFNFDKDTNSITKVTTITPGGTTTCRLNQVSWRPDFFIACGRGDSFITAMCIEGDSIIDLGQYRENKSLIGMFFMPDHYIKPQNYEMIRFVKAVGTIGKATIDYGAITLPRTANFSKLGLYEPFPTDVPSINIDEWRTTSINDEIQIKTLDPVTELNDLMTLNKFESVGNTLRKPIYSSLKKPSKPEISKSNHIVKSNSVSKSEVKKPETKNEKVKEEDFSSVIGKPLQAKEAPTRKSSFSASGMEARLKSLEERVAELETTVKILKRSDDMQIQISDIDVSDSEFHDE